jgi:glycerol-3-phosphate dehydrogenase
MGGQREKRLKAQVLIIGGGATGTGLARDLSLRGVQCILVEKGDVNAGASGANHGLLHSGARYVSSDPNVARECAEEAALLKMLAPQCIEETGGLFAALEGDDENYAADFPHLCRRCDVPVKPLTTHEARELEPNLSEHIVAAYSVEDASIDPFRLVLENIAHAEQLGTSLLFHTKVVGFNKKGHRIQSAHLVSVQNGEETVIEAEQVVNATGAWTAEVSAMAGASVDMLYSKGTLLVTDRRLTGRVVNRLRPPSDGDILVPAGTVSILGTTSVRIAALDQIRPTVKEVDLIVKEGARMLPLLETSRYIRAFAGVRPLLSPKAECDDRTVGRGFNLLDHTSAGLENFLSIPGGKLTTYRLMAEKTADRVCERLGVSSPCLTRKVPIPSTQSSSWTTPGLAPRVWLKKNDPEDLMLCECEMVPSSVIESVMDACHSQKGTPTLRAISLRTRMGKGQCQGTFCGFRVAAYMHDRGQPPSDNGLAGLLEFLRDRWRGEIPVLWGSQLVQAELKEALYCGLCELDSWLTSKRGKAATACVLQNR